MASKTYRTNPTRLQKIERDRVGINVRRDPAGKAVAFTLDRLELTDLELPAEAVVALVAYTIFDERRVSLGTVGALTLPGEVSLSEMEAPVVTFRIFVRQPDGHVLLATCEGIRAREETPLGRTPLLAILYAPLGERLWDLHLSGGSEPVLRINDNRDLDLRAEFDTRNPLVRGLIVPQAIEQVLVYLLLNPVNDDDPAKWQNVWNAWLKSRSREVPELREFADLPEAQEWARQTTDLFSHEVKFTTQAIARKINTGHV